MTVNKSFWSKDSLLRARDYEDDGNMLLRTAYFYSLGGVINLSLVYLALAKMERSGEYAQHPDAKRPDGTIYDRASHDEMTGIFYFESLPESKHWSNEVNIQNAKCWKYVYQPQVFFHLLSCKYRSRLSLFVSSIWMLGGVWSKKIEKNGILETDGPLLSILKIKTIENLGMKVPFKELIIKRLVKNWGDNYERELILTMFYDINDAENPLRQLVF